MRPPTHLVEASEDAPQRFGGVLSEEVLQGREVDVELRVRVKSSRDRSQPELAEISLRFYMFAIPLSPPAPVLPRPPWCSSDAWRAGGGGQSQAIHARY
jgi:hypothetical protein